MRLDVGRRHRLPRQDEVTKAGGEALNLALDPVRHVHGAGVRHVAVRPARVMTFGRARAVEHALLRHEDERALGDAAVHRRVFGCRQVLEGTGDMHGRRAQALRRRPGNGPPQRPVDLEDAGTLPESPELAPERGGERVPRNAIERARGHVEQHGTRTGQLIQSRDVAVHFDDPAHRLEIGGQAVDDALRPALGTWPVRCMTDESEDEPERRGRDGVHGQERMSSTATEQGPRPGTAKARAHERRTAAQPNGAEARHPDGMTGNAHRLEDVGEKRIRVGEKRPHQAFPRFPVRAQRLPRGGQRPMQDRRGAVIERMGERCGCLHPFQSELSEREAAQQGRHHTHRVDGRADVVVKPWQRDVFGAASAANRRLGLQHQNRLAGFREHHRGGQPVRPCTHHDRVVRRFH
jgi:hypothetical protein